MGIFNYHTLKKHLRAARNDYTLLSFPIYFYVKVNWSCGFITPREYLIESTTSCREAQVVGLPGIEPCPLNYSGCKVRGQHHCATTPSYLWRVLAWVILLGGLYPHERILYAACYDIAIFPKKTTHANGFFKIYTNYMLWYLWNSSHSGEDYFVIHPGFFLIQHCHLMLRSIYLPCW